MGLNEFLPQPREGLMTKQLPCAPWPAASFNQGIWHLPKLLGYEEPKGEERRGFGRKWRRDCRGRSEEMRKKKKKEDNRKGEESAEKPGEF